MITVTIPIILVYIIAIIGVASLFVGLVSKKKKKIFFFALFFFALIVCALFLMLPTVIIK